MGSHFLRSTLCLQGFHLGQEGQCLQGAPIIIGIDDVIITTVKSRYRVEVRGKGKRKKLSLLTDSPFSPSRPSFPATPVDPYVFI